MNDKFIDEINKATTLQQLFEKWKEHQIREVIDNDPKSNTLATKEKTEYPYKNLFCPDGVTSEAGVSNPQTDETKVLFILKEANLSEEIKKNTVSPSPKFWFNCDKEESTRKKYMESFAACLDKLGVDRNVNFGYMNLNKRGGFGRTDNRRLNNYIRKYVNEIRRQVFIMNPEYVLCCGCYDSFMRCFHNDEINEISRYSATVRIDNHQFNVIYVYHPACGVQRVRKQIDSLNLFLG